MVKKINLVFILSNVSLVIFVLISGLYFTGCVNNKCMRKANEWDKAIKAYELALNEYDKAKTDYEYIKSVLEDMISEYKQLNCDDRPEVNKKRCEELEKEKSQMLVIVKNFKYTLKLAETDKTVAHTVMITKEANYRTCCAQNPGACPQ